MSILRPKFIAIDSAIIGKWATDFYSNDFNKRNLAKTVFKYAGENSWIPVICLHHLEELVRHSDEKKGEERIKFLYSFPILAWIGRADGLNHLGSVVDVQAEEIRTFLSNEKITLDKQISITRAELLHIGKPQDIETLGVWKEIRPYMVKMQYRQQEISSLCHVANSENDKVQLSVLNNIKGRASEAQVEEIYNEEVATLTTELENRGDKRIEDQEKVSQVFNDIVFSLFDGVVFSKRLSNRDAFIEQFGFSPQDFSDNVTLGEFKRTVVRYKKLSISVEQLGLDISDVWPKLKGALFPSENIVAEIRKSRKNAVRSGGSDLYDDYLSSLIPYLDMVIVDKRTNEYLNQAKKRMPTTFGSFGPFTKISNYHDLPNVLGEVN